MDMWVLICLLKQHGADYQMWRYFICLNTEKETKVKKKPNYYLMRKISFAWQQKRFVLPATNPVAKEQTLIIYYNGSEVAKNKINRSSTHNFTFFYSKLCIIIIKL
jgi:hypothetical protein